MPNKKQSQIAIYEELNKFKHIKYHDEPHKYFIGDKELTSGTTFLGRYKEKFDAPKKAIGTAKKEKKTVAEVLAQWEYKRDFSGVKGTMVHNFAENYWANKVFPLDFQLAQDKFGIDGGKNMEERVAECIRMFKEFYTDASRSLIPIASELVIGDEYLPVLNEKGEVESTGVGGMVDGLFWNSKVGELQIWDYKTNGKIRSQSDYGNRMKYPISFLHECEFESYSLQLNLYKYIIEKNTNLKIGKLYLVWIHEENETYQVIECKDYQEIIQLLFKQPNN